MQLAPQIMRMVLLRQQQQHFASRLPSLPCLVSTALLLACDHAAGNGGDTDGADVAAAAAGSSERHHGRMPRPVDPALARLSALIAEIQSMLEGCRHGWNVTLRGRKHGPANFPST
eukprot:COSAG01_NODE_4786_length_4745_cov_95.210073_6_plen_116_part_00